MKSMITGGVLLVLLGLASPSFGQQYATPGMESYRSMGGGSYTYAPPNQSYNYGTTVPQGSYSTPDHRFQGDSQAPYQTYPSRPVGGFFNRLMELERRKNQWLFGRPRLF